MFGIWCFKCNLTRAFLSRIAVINPGLLMNTISIIREAPRQNRIVIYHINKGKESHMSCRQPMERKKLYENVWISQRRKIMEAVGTRLYYYDYDLLH
jgi:hypothetical protein